LSCRLDCQGRPVRALGLTSGGLDSLLALLVVRDQGVEVEALTFVSPFLQADKARQGCQAVGVPLREVDFSSDHIQVVRQPRFGRGANMNPCLDCHVLMFGLARRIQEEEGFHFIFSGEVLGQRPMSQHRAGLDLVARESGASQLLLRPLSAKRLEPTRPEKEGWVDRDRLLDFQGRSRKPQMALAQKYGLTDYPSPAGGCPLTDPGFSRRLKSLLDLQPGAGAAEMELLRLGRHFHLGQGVKLILGRNQAENERLEGLTPRGQAVLKAVGAPGPLGLISEPGGRRPQPEAGQERLALAGRIVLSYSDAAGPRGQVQVQTPEKTQILDLPVEDKAGFREMMIE